MAIYTEFALEDGGSVMVRAEKNEPKPTGLRSGDASKSTTVAGNTVRKAARTLEATLADLKPVVSAIGKTVSGFGNPDEVTVEFTITLTAEAGIVISSASVEGSIALSVSWKRGSPDVVVPSAGSKGGAANATAAGEAKTAK